MSRHHPLSGRFLLLVALAALGCAPAVDVPGVMAYQGRIATASGPFSGTGSFKFALVDQTGATSSWSNDGTSVAGSQPTAPVLISVQGGLFSVMLGDSAYAGMTAVVPATAFTNDRVYLRIWFSASGSPGSFELMTPDRRMATAGYAFLAQAVADGAIGDAQVSSLSFSKLTGTPSVVANGGATPAIVAGTTRPGSPVTGTLFVDTAGQVIERWNGSAWTIMASATVGTVGDGQITGAKLANGAVDLAGVKVTGVLPLSAGGTGGTTAASARTNLGLGDAATADSSAFVANAGTTPAILSGAADPTVAPPSGTGTLYVATSSPGIYRWSGSVWQSVAVSSNNLAGDVTGPSGTTVVAQVGGVTAANVAAGATLANAATDANTVSTIVKRDASGNFSAGTITAQLTGNVTGNVTGSAGSFTGNLAGDVTGAQGTTVVAQVGGVTAANVATGVTLATAATDVNTASTIVKRDASGNFTAGTVTATAFSGPLNGNVTGTATNVTGIVASANGGTGVNNAGTITNAVNTTITGGGTLDLGGFTLTVPATGTAALLGATNTFSAANTYSAAGAASTPVEKLTGAWYTGGTGITTKPQLLVEPSTATSSGWSTSGTGVGVNSAASFAGNLADLKVDGASKFTVDASGTATAVRATISNQVDLPQDTNPVTKQAGSLRYNTTSRIVEFYDSVGATWAPVNAYAP